MQVDYAPYNIRVNALLPGTILTPFVKQYLRQSYADPEEMYAALFLASDESKFMMGSPLYIDGVVVFGKNA